MKAVVCTKYGAPDVLKITELDKPKPKNNEVLIKVMSASINSGDVRVRGLQAKWLLRIVIRLIFGLKRPRKGILGTTFSGIIEEVGKNVKIFKPGDTVFGSCGFKLGAHSEYITLQDTAVLCLKPKTASFDEAAAILFGGMTAIYFLQKVGINSIPNPKILIYGATGSVGMAAIEIAKYYKAYVKSVCSRDGVELVKALRSDEIVIYSEQDYSKLNDKFDIVFDTVGKTKKKEAINILKKDGKYLTVGGLDVAKETKSQVELLKELFEKGKIKANIDKTYLLKDVVEAHKYVDTERKKGNVILKIKE